LFLQSFTSEAQKNCKSSFFAADFLWLLQRQLSAGMCKTISAEVFLTSKTAFSALQKLKN
jgi:hypothetical protein